MHLQIVHSDIHTLTPMVISSARKEHNSDSNVSVHLVLQDLTLTFYIPSAHSFFSPSVLSSKVTHQHPATNVITPTHSKCLWFMFFCSEIHFEVYFNFVCGCERGEQIYLEYIHAETNAAYLGKKEIGTSEHDREKVHTGKTGKTNRSGCCCLMVQSIYPLNSGFSSALTHLCLK